MKKPKLFGYAVMLAMLLVCAGTAGACEFDLDNNGIVDGRDIFLFTQLGDPTQEDYIDLASQFGKIDCIIAPAPQITFTAEPLYTNGSTSSTLSWTVLNANSIVIDPGPGDATGSTSTIVTPAATTVYTLTATGKGGSSQSTVTVTVDTVPPAMISFYPLNSSVIASGGSAITLLGTFGDDLSGIHSIVLRDEANADITADATVTGSTISYVIPAPQEKTYNFSVVLEDNATNTTTYPVTFSVDNTIPVTTSSVPPGRYSSPVTLNLTASEPAVIYYSTDGYPPYVGAANTQFAPSPVSGILIDATTRLQFFAVDSAGNMEQTQAVDYLFNDVTAPVTGLTAVYSDSPRQVNLSWNGSAAAQTYHIYRCMSLAERGILLSSKANGYPPPKRLRIGTTGGAASGYADTASLVDGADYYYGVTYTDAAGVESVISNLAQATVTAQNQAANVTEAVARAVAWLQNNQHQNSAWGAGGRQVLATSQALNGLWAAGVENAGTFQGLFFLRGSRADNNDYMARKILTLFQHGQNVDETVNRLISRSYIYNAQIYGWAANPVFVPDALDTALGAKALACLSVPLTDADGTPLTDIAKLALESWPTLQGPVATQYGWVPGKDISAFVSAAVYSVTTPSTPTTQWLGTLQQANGSIENSITDTAGVLIWQTAVITDKAAARQYLVSTQQNNGSWSNDPYLTGLCLEALLK